MSMTVSLGVVTLTVVRYSRSLLRIKIDIKVQNRGLNALSNVSEMVFRYLRTMQLFLTTAVSVTEHNNIYYY